MPTGSESSEKEEKIKKEAERILEKFAKALERVEKVPDSFVERVKDRRIDGKGKTPDSEFRKIFFENAPATSKDCIQGERGGWK